MAKDIKLPWHTTDQTFVAEMRNVGEGVEKLDCSDCSFLTQQSFLQLSREKLIFPQLTHLLMPETGVFPDLVFECLSEMCPSLEEILNVRQNNNNSCNQLKCYSNFKNLKVVYDNPVCNYGRLSNTSKNERQRRQNWEQDVAKIAINCQKVERYVCNGGKGYLDDKSFERVALLMPRLTALELKRCYVSDEGVAKFFSLNRSRNITKLTLDEAGSNITDVTLNLVAENCPNLTHLRVMRNDKYTAAAINHILTSSKHLIEFSFDGRHSPNNNHLDIRSFDENTFHILSIQSPSLTFLKLYRCDLSFKRILSFFHQLQSLHLYDCCFSHATSFTDFLTTLPSLTELSFVDCAFVSPDLIINIIIKLSNLSSLTLFCRHKDFYSDVSTLAKEAYTKLTGENGGRFKLSGIKHLSLQGVSGAFLRLITALCSQITQLDFRHTLSNTTNHCVHSDDLVEVLTSCELLKHLEVISTASAPFLTDAFFQYLPTTSLETLSIDFSLKNVSRIAVSKAFSKTPYLQNVTLDVGDGDIDDVFLREVLEGCREKRWVKVVEDGGRKVVRMRFSPLLDN